MARLNKNRNSAMRNMDDLRPKNPDALRQAVQRKKREENFQRRQPARQKLQQSRVRKPAPQKVAPPRQNQSPVQQFIAWLRGDQYGNKHAPDLAILYTMIGLVFVGLVMVYSSSSYKSLLETGRASTYFIKQFIWMIIGIAGLIAAYKVPIALTQKFALPGFVISIFLVLLVTFIGKEVDGAKRWIMIGSSIQFTPSDFAKLFGVIYFADYLSKREWSYIKFNEFIVLFGILAILPVLIVIEDLGTALTLAGALFIMLILAGVPGRYIWGTVFTGLAGIVGAILIEPYRIRRITGFLDPFSSENLAGNGWQLVQSLYAFGSGGFFGTGLGNGGQKLMYLPAMHTDFIFSVYAEEMGFIGAVILLGAFMYLFYRGMLVSNKLKDPYSSLCAAGLISIIGIQALINISVCVGVFPVTGITLPFISYGGTSLVVMMTTVGFILNLSQYTIEDK